MSTRGRRSSEKAVREVARKGIRSEVTNPANEGDATIGLSELKGGSGSIVEMTSTEAQNGFGRLLETVGRDRTVVITRHNAAKAVVMSVERYDELTRSGGLDLNALTDEFNELLERMQSSDARAGLRTGFRASPEELSQAAIAALERATK